MDEVLRFLKNEKYIFHMIQSCHIGCIPQRVDNRVQKHICTPVFLSSIVHNSWKLEATRMSILKEMDKRDEVYTCTEILFSLENTGISDTRYNMEETWKHYAET